jgi:transposase
MDGNIDSGLVSRLEVVETGRRRRWSDAEKLRIVAESMAGPRLVSATARRRGCQSALKIDPGSASNFDPLSRG